jgi:uncharacterized membrane protein
MPKGRLESFSDCVIAFAITLLVLDIHLQEVGTNIDSAGMIHAIMGQAAHFSVYVISFLICTVAWGAHHELIHDLDHVDTKLLWLNSLFLMWIGFLPFPTGLLGTHPGQPVAVALYGTICATTCLSFSAMRWYASFRGRLMKKGIAETKLRRTCTVPCFFLFFTLQAWALGCSSRLLVCSFTPLSLRLTRLADCPITKAASRCADPGPAGPDTTCVADYPCSEAFADWSPTP